MEFFFVFLCDLDVELCNQQQRCLWTLRRTQAKVPVENVWFRGSRGYWLWCLGQRQQCFVFRIFYGKLSLIVCSMYFYFYFYFYLPQQFSNNKGNAVNVMKDAGSSTLCFTDSWFLNNERFALSFGAPPSPSPDSIVANKTPPKDSVIDGSTNVVFVSTRMDSSAPSLAHFSHCEVSGNACGAVQFQSFGAQENCNGHPALARIVVDSCIGDQVAMSQLTNFENQLRFEFDK